MTTRSIYRRLKIILFVGAIAIFLSTEMVVGITLWTIPSDHLIMGSATRYFSLIVVSFPMVAGINGYRATKYRLGSTGSDHVDEFSIRFLITIVVAYIAITFLMSVLQGLSVFH
jgi:hypothetical protein